MRGLRIVVLFTLCWLWAGNHSQAADESDLVKLKDLLSSNSPAALDDALQLAEELEADGINDPGFLAGVSRSFSRYARKTVNKAAYRVPGPADAAALSWALAASRKLGMATADQTDQILFALLECIGNYGGCAGRGVAGQLADLTERIKSAVDRVLSVNKAEDSGAAAHLYRIEVFLSEMEPLNAKQNQGKLVLALTMEVNRLADAVGAQTYPPEVSSDRLSRVAKQVAVLSECLAKTSKTSGASRTGLLRFRMSTLSAVAAREMTPEVAAEVRGELLTGYRQLLEEPQHDARELAERGLAVADAMPETKGDKGNLSHARGWFQQTIAQIESAESDRNPKNRKLQKAAGKAWSRALDYYADAVKSNPKPPMSWATAYNECLWQVKDRTRGKDKRKPVMVDQKTGDRAILLQVPRSSKWRVSRLKVASDSQLVYRCFKNDKKEATYVSISVWRYRWDTNYITEDGASVGGDNIGGMARRDEAGFVDIFTDIKGRTPLRKMPLNRYIRKAQALDIAGMTDSKYPFQIRAYYFKNSDRKATYCVTFMGPMGIFDDRKWELQSIIASIRPAK